MKFGVGFYWYCIERSPPTRGCGLKFQAVYRHPQIKESPPTRGCGLKWGGLS